MNNKSSLLKVFNTHLLELIHILRENKWTENAIDGFITNLTEGTVEPHSDSDINKALSAFKKIGKKLKIIK